MKIGCFIGLTCLDFIYYVDGMPLENKKIKTNDYSQYIGGPAANAAITYSLLGGKAKLVTYIGNSEVGINIKSELIEKYNIDIIDLSDFNDIPSIATILVNTNNGNRTIVSGQQLVNKLDNIKLDKKIIEADFYFSDCNISDLSLQYLLKIKNQNKTIILDLGSWKEHMNHFILLADEIIASNDCKPSNGENIIDYINNIGNKKFAVSNGENEIIWIENDKNGNINPKKVEAIDTLGAGDILHGAYCYYRFEKNMSFIDSIKYASSIATLSVQYKGTREWSNHIN